MNYLADSVNIVLASYNLPTHDVESYKYRVGNGIRKLMQRSLPEDKQDLLDEALEKFKAVYARHNMDKTRPYEGITELLEKLRAQNIKLGVCTNKHDEAAKVIIKALFVNLNAKRPAPSYSSNVTVYWLLLSVGPSMLLMEMNVSSG